MRMKMRIIHRYLGFFLAGIMAVYAISGIVLIFRDSDAFTNEVKHTVQLKKELASSQLGKALDMRRFKLVKESGNIIYFKNGSYNKKSGKAEYTSRELPMILEKMTHLHKAESSQPLAFLNIFFGCSLLFFVISAFWMYLPKTSVFKRGIYFSLGGLILALVLLFV